MSKPSFPTPFTAQHAHALPNPCYWLSSPLLPPCFLPYPHTHTQAHKHTLAASAYQEELRRAIEPFVYEWTAGHRGSVSAEHGEHACRAACASVHVICTAPSSTAFRSDPLSHFPSVTRVCRVCSACQFLHWVFPAPFLFSSGLGAMKANCISYSKPAPAIDVMRQVKRLFDPHGILNPYKVLPRA